VDDLERQTKEEEEEREKKSRERGEEYLVALEWLI
jgi:hypothetical protein